ncbi:unnamed protein product [Coregonus sp. 'balchen']|nr:unnamed protein product [Coregonus sp. 'balchen']
MEKGLFATISLSQKRKASAKHNSEENKLQEDDTVQKLKEEMKQFREESRASIAKLKSRMDKLSQTNDDLRDHLSTHKRGYIDTLNQQLVIMSSASREHVHQLGTTQVRN